MRPKTEWCLALLALTALVGPAAGQDRARIETAVRTVIQEQADAFNRSDLDATMATMWDDVEWRTIQRELISGAERLRPAMEGWISGIRGEDVRLVYPPDEVRVGVLSDDHAVADVVLIWDAGPDRRTGTENLFFVLERRSGSWRILHVRNTTTHACAVRPAACGA